MDAKSIKKVACVGAGVIGSSFAANFVMKGYPVVICDIDEKQLAEAKQYIEKNLKYLAEKNVITWNDIKKTLPKVEYSTDYGVLREVQFIQENGPEKYDIKHLMLEQIEKHAPENAIIASSTSGLIISEIAKMAKHPERCIGGHPYNPPHLIPLIDLVRGEKTSDEVAQCAYDFYKLLGKEPIIIKKEVPGFIANRLQMALYREAADMVMRDVCTVEDIDKALVFGPGLRWALLGVFICFELSGAKAGIEGLLEKLEPAWNDWLKDMADWKDFPSDWKKTVQEGVNAELANREPQFGRNHEDIIRFRDDSLLEILKMHNKL